MNSNESLLQSLKSLYAKLHIESLQQRIHNYFLSTHSHNQHDISSTLHQLIDELVEDVSHHAITNKITDNEKSERLTTNLQPSKHSSPNEDNHEPVTHTADSLSFYFKNSKAQEKDPSTAVMLRRRIWEHVHSARRLARNGDKDSAKMHADIASQGLKTLAHYMPPREHSEFLAIIIKQLSRTPDENKYESKIETI